jgi:hypothetical protein
MLVGVKQKEYMKKKLKNFPFLRESGQSCSKKQNIKQTMLFIIVSKEYLVINFTKGTKCIQLSKSQLVSLKK